LVASAWKIGLAYVPVAKAVEGKLPLLDQFQYTSVFRGPGMERALAAARLPQWLATFLDPLE